MKVVKIDVNDKLYGGRVYENQVVSGLQDEIVFERVFLKKYSFMLFNIPRIIFLWIKYHFFCRDILFLTSATSFFAGRKAKNIIIIHHIDVRFSLKPKEFYEWFVIDYIFRHKKAYNTIVTVSQYWKEILTNKGLLNVEVIYNSFDIEEFQYSQEEKKQFLACNKLTGKPVIYLGNCRKGKGADIAYELLKTLDVHFVTSGTSDITLPVPNLMLSYEDYKLLLASSSVVMAMSTFKEGWNRTVHEASLCGTRVIGSGIAGMGELLDIANQIKVSDFGVLKEIVENNLFSKYTPPQELIKLNTDYFKKSWLNVFKNVYNYN